MKITIVGGGTAGWLAAYCLSVAQPNIHAITVIESSKLGIIGAGEGSTGILHDLLSGRLFGDNGLDINEFMRKTDSTNKFGILHQNWDRNNNKYFAPIDGSISCSFNDDLVFKFILQKFGYDKFHISSKLGLDYEIGVDNDDSAFHFDGHKVGQFFKNICIEKNVKVLDAVVQNIDCDQNGHIVSLSLDNNTSVSGDFFIDCTGFSRTLMNKIGSEWVSYKKYLPVDSAMPFILNYENNENVLPVTKATALSSGWMWNIPLLTRKGCGYVFDSSYITKEQAKTEIETYLGVEIEPIKFINFTSGRSDKFWKNNVLSLGLASSFVEPLEATSIHTTIIQIYQFITGYLTNDKNTTVTVENEKLYNRITSNLFESIFDFISLHYQGKKEDSIFWQDIQNNRIVTDYATDILERSKYKVLTNQIFEDQVLGSPGAPLYNWILAGMQQYDLNLAREELKRANVLDKANTIYSDWYIAYQNDLNNKYQRI